MQRERKMKLERIKDCKKEKKSRDIERKTKKSKEIEKGKGVQEGRQVGGEELEGRNGKILEGRKEFQEENRNIKKNWEEERSGGIRKDNKEEKRNLKNTKGVQKSRREGEDG